MTAPFRAGVALLAAALAGFSPLEAEEENVREGNARLRAGDAAEARRRYDAAERAVGPRPEIDFDRGHAAMAEGRAAEAAEAFGRAAQAAPPRLASRALQNRGNALAAAGDREGALRAFAQALERDAANEDARWNLEVLLREEERSRAEPRAGEGEEGRREEAAAAPSPASGAASPPAAPEEPTGSAPRAGTGAAPARGAEETRPRPGDEGDARRGLSRQEAEALLDALRAGERQMPLFGPERKERGRRDAAKDW